MNASTKILSFLMTTLLISSQAAWAAESLAVQPVDSTVTTIQQLIARSMPAEQSLIKAKPQLMAIQKSQTTSENLKIEKKAKAQGGSNGGGGNWEEADFINTARMINQKLVNELSLVSEHLNISVTDFQNALDTTDIRCAAEPMLTEIKRLNQMARFDGHKTVYLNCDRYEQLKSAPSKDIVVFHEYMRRIGAEGSDYKVSSKLPTLLNQIEAKSILKMALMPGAYDNDLQDSLWFKISNWDGQYLVTGQLVYETPTGFEVILSQVTPGHYSGKGTLTAGYVFGGNNVISCSYPLQMDIYVAAGSKEKVFIKMDAPAGLLVRIRDQRDCQISRERKEVIFKTPFTLRK